LATAEEISQMRQLAQIPRRATGERSRSDAPAEYGDAEDVRFHLAIASAARNGLALELIERCLAQVDRFMSLGVNFGQFQDGATEAHLAIVDAIAERNPDAARVRMEEHLDCGSERMKDALLRGQVTAIGVD
jgi:DNA-binding FadR family transcriptional regulator